MSLLWAFTASSAPAAPDKQNLTIANGDWAPYTGRELPDYGPLSKLVSDAFEQAGVTVNYVFRPWKRGLYEAASGELDATLGWSRTEERATQFYFGGPIMLDGVTIYLNRDHLTGIQQISDLTGKRICNLNGAVLPPGLNDMLSDGQILESSIANDEKGLFRNLYYGRCDFTARNANAGAAALQQSLSRQQQEKIVSFPDILPKRAYYLLISKQSERADWLRAKFEEGLRKLGPEAILTN